MNRRVLAAVLAGMLLWSLAACGRDLPASLQVGTSTFAPSDREALPPISGNTLDGQPLTVEQYAGKVVVLNAWASWCGPCKEEVPDLVTLASSLDPDVATVIGLNVSDDAKAAAAFATEYQMPYPSIEDPKGAILPTIPGVPPAALPSTVVVDQQGRIAARIIGAANGAELARIVDSVAAEQPAG